MDFFVCPKKGIRNLRERTYEEMLDMLEAYGFDRILEDSNTDKASVLLVLDELGFIELEMYDDDY